jgi:hypothetical protein
VCGSGGRLVHGNGEWVGLREGVDEWRMGCGELS